MYFEFPHKYSVFLNRAGSSQPRSQLKERNLKWRSTEILEKKKNLANQTSTSEFEPATSWTESTVWISSPWVAQRGTKWSKEHFFFVKSRGIFILIIYLYCILRITILVPGISTSTATSSPGENLPFSLRPMEEPAIQSPTQERNSDPVSNLGENMRCSLRSRWRSCDPASDPRENLRSSFWPRGESRRRARTV